MIGICGDHCVYCPRHVATQNGGAEALEEVPAGQLLSKEGAGPVVEFVSPAEPPAPEEEAS